MNSFWEKRLESPSTSLSLNQLYPMRAYSQMSLWQLTPEKAFSINAYSKTSLRQRTQIARRGPTSFNFIAYSRKSLQEQHSQGRSASSRKSLRQLTWMTRRGSVSFSFRDSFERACGSLCFMNLGSTKQTARRELRSISLPIQHLQGETKKLTQH